MKKKNEKSKKSDEGVKELAKTIAFLEKRHKKKKK